MFIITYLVPSSARRNASKCFGCLWSLHKHIHTQNICVIAIFQMNPRYPTVLLIVTINAWPDALLNSNEQNQSLDSFFIHTLTQSLNNHMPHTHTCLTALCLGLPGWTGTRKVNQSDFTETRDIQWQVCTSLQTDNHASTPPLSFLLAGCPSCRPTNSVKALKVINPVVTN